MSTCDPSPLTVSHATRADLRRLAEIVYLAKALRHENPDIVDVDDEIGEEYTSMTAELTLPHATLLKATDEQNMILGVAAYYHYHATDPTIIRLYRFYTLPSEKKPGGALMEFFLEDAKNKGAKRVCLTATNDNAEGFYRHHGFYDLPGVSRGMQKHLE